MNNILLSRTPDIVETTLKVSSGNNHILILSGLKSLDFRPLFSLTYGILISGDKVLISIFYTPPVGEILRAVLS